MARSNDARLAASFDRRLARRDKQRFPTGSSNSRRKSFINKRNVEAGTAGNRVRVALGTQSLKAPTRTAYNRQFSSPKTTSASQTAVSAFKGSINNIFDEATKAVIQRQNTDAAIKMAQAKRENDDDSFWVSIAKYGLEHLPMPVKMGRGIVDPEYVENLNAQAEQAELEGKGSWQGAFESFSNSPVGRALDVVSRPFYGVNEFMKGTLEADYAGEDFWQSLGHGLREGVSGLAGTEKTGFGDVLNTYLEGSKSAPASAFRDFEAEHPEAAQWAQRAGGLAGDIAIDPIKSIHPGSSTVLAKTGQEASAQGVKDVIRQTADTAVRDALDDIRLTRGKARWRPSNDAVSLRALNNADQMVDNSLLSISAGARSSFSKMGGEQFAQATSNSVAQTVRDSILEPFERNLDNLTQPVAVGRTPNMSQIRTAISRNPEFEELLDNLETELAAKGRTYATLDDMVANLGPRDLPLIKRTAIAVRNGLDPIIDTVADRVYSESKDLTYNTLGIKLPTGKTVPVKTVGKAWKAIKGSAGEDSARNIEDAVKQISYEHNFPGRISLMTQRARSLGRENFELFRDDLAKLARDYSPAQAKEIQYALDEGRTLTGTLEVARKQLEDMYRQIMLEEIATGVRPKNAKWMDAYAYIYNRGGSRDARASFKDGRKKLAKGSGTYQKGPYNMVNAKHGGLNPVENAFEAMLLRKMKSSRDLSRAYFLKDLVDNYGIVSGKLSPAAVKGRRLEEIGAHQLDQTTRAMLARTGEKMYIPKAHHDLFKAYNELSSFDPRQGGKPMRAFNKITSWLKWASTVPRPGFHVRNMIGDYFMGLLDNVPTRTYSEVATKWEAWKHAGKMPRFRITKNISHSIEDMWKKFEDYANTGFFETELQQAGVSPGIKGRAGKVVDKMREVSENRENFGRFTHFVAAYRQEAEALVKKGMKDGTSQLEKKALEAAVWRVNHYKFDYNALTALERRVKLAFPFYTFSRKATPVLLESLFLSPHYMGVANRFMTLQDGSSADAFNSYYLPDYVKDTGYAFLGQDSPEPFMLSGSIVPVQQLNSLDFTNSQQFAQSLVQQTNPMIQAPAELATNEQFFSGRPTGSLSEYLLQKLPVGMNMWEEGAKAQQQGPGSSDFWLNRLNDSFLGAGIPVTQFTKEQQDYGFREAEDRFIQDPFFDFNRSQDRIRVYASNRADGTQSFRVQDKATGDLIFESRDPREALTRAKQFAR